jgi:hypothetical protein
MTAPEWNHYVALKVEYADFLRRLAAFNERVKRARKAGYPPHMIPRLPLRSVRDWARLYNSGTPARRRYLTGRKRGA